MGTSNLQDYRVLFVHSSVTCIHFAGILLFIHFNEHLHSIGFYKYLFLLSTIIVADLLKLSLTSSQLDHVIIGKQDLNYVAKSKRSNRILKNILKFVVATVGITAIYHVVIVLFGAPFFADFDKTLVLATTLTLLTLVPACFHLGVDNALALFIGYPAQISGSIVEAIKLNIKTVLFGTWISAFVLPLDWDRPWQAWPIPCVVGALLGYFAAHFITFVNASTMKFKRKARRTTSKNC